MLDALTRCELVVVRARGDPLQSSFMQRRFFYVTRKGLEFLEAYRRIHSLLEYLEKEVSITKDKPTAPIDFVGAPD